MSTTYEDGKAALDQLIAWYEDNSDEHSRNEATTRLHLIDTLLVDVLNWPKEEIDAEHEVDQEYTDYALGKPAARMIAEAKREGAHFTVPVGITALIHKLPSLTGGPGGRQLKSAIAQAARYCAGRGVQLAMICNGTQVIAFLGVRTDGIPPLNGSALVFSSLSAMRENFHALWHNLSRYGVEARNLHVTLREGEAPSAPSPLAVQIPHYPGHRRRSDIQTGLQILADLFLEDITRDPNLQEEFLRATYATSGALSQYAMVSKQILQSRYSMLHEPSVDIETEPAVSKLGMNPKIREDILASSLSRRPIILLGDVGVGKTMFIRRLIHVDAKDVFDESIVAYVDFGSQPLISINLDDYVMSEIENQLLLTYQIDIQERDFVEAVYHAELRRFEKTIYGEAQGVRPRGLPQRATELPSRQDIRPRVTSVLGIPALTWQHATPSCHLPGQYRPMGFGVPGKDLHPSRGSCSALAGDRFPLTATRHLLPIQVRRRPGSLPAQSVHHRAATRRRRTQKATRVRIVPVAQQRQTGQLSNRCPHRVRLTYGLPQSSPA